MELSMQNSRKRCWEISMEARFLLFMRMGWRNPATFGTVSVLKNLEDIRSCPYSFDTSFMRSPKDALKRC